MRMEDGKPICFGQIRRFLKCNDERKSTIINCLGKDLGRSEEEVFTPDWSSAVAPRLSKIAAI